MIILVPSELEILERAVDLLRVLAQSAPKEETRRAGDELQHLDHLRRNAAKGLHPIAGQTQDEYEAYMADRREVTGGGGRHGVTGETAEQYEIDGWQWGNVEASQA